MGMIVTDQRWQPQLLGWLNDRCPGVKDIEGTIRTLAYVDAQPDAVASPDDILTVCALSRWTQHTCEATLATNGAKRAKASREFIWTVFDYVFNHAGRSRLYTFVQTDNVKSIAVQQMLGLQQEAILADHFGPGKDAALFGITKAQWLAGPWAKADDQ